MRLCTPPPCSPPPQIVLRKGYHLLAVALFLPAFAADLPLLCAALAVAFAALAAAEVARCCSVPRLGRIVEAFMQVGGRGGRQSTSHVRLHRRRWEAASV